MERKIWLRFTGWLANRTIRLIRTQTCSYIMLNSTKHKKAARKPLNWKRRITKPSAKVYLGVAILVVSFLPLLISWRISELNDWNRIPQADQYSLLTPHVNRELCLRYSSSAKLIWDVKTKYTSFYPHNRRVFLQHKLSKLICSATTHRIRLFLAITTRPDAFDTRTAIRHTFASRTACRDRLFAAHNITCEHVWAHTRYAFFTGLNASNALVNELTQIESTTHRDMVLLTKVERYDDLTLKTLSIFHWVSLFCTQAEFVVKIDDDSIFNLGNIFSSLDYYATRHDHFIVGYVQHKASFNRDETSPWYTPKSVIPNDTAPHYAFGCGYIIPIRTVRLLYDAGRCVASISIEDLYITGMLRESLNISLVMQPCINCFSLRVREALKSWDVLHVLHHVNVSEMREIWSGALHRRRLPQNGSVISNVTLLEDARCSWKDTTKSLLSLDAITSFSWFQKLLDFKIFIAA